MPTHIVVIYRNFGSTIVTEFDSRDAAAAFAQRYYYLSPAKDQYSVFYPSAEEYLGGMGHSQMWLYNGDAAAYSRRTRYALLSERGTVLLDPAEALTIFVQDEPEGYLVGESEVIWSRNTKTHADLDAELDDYFAKEEYVMTD